MRRLIPDFHECKIRQKNTENIKNSPNFHNWYIFFQQYEEQQRRNKEAEFTELVRDFLNPGEFYNACVGLGIDYFTGVPDSLLKGSKLKILCNLKKVKHLATN